MTADNITISLQSQENLVSMLRRELLKDIRRVIREELVSVGRDDPNRFLTAEEAGRMLGINVKAVHKRVERGQLPVRRIGRRLRFRLGDLLLLGLNGG